MMAENPTVQLHDLRIRDVWPLVSPASLRDDLALTDAGVATVVAGRKAVHDVVSGGDDRLMVVVGPCSVHDPVAALDYAERLQRASVAHRDDLLLVMRVYFEKPRTVTGWKGLINDPHLDDSGDVGAGLRMARRLLVQISDLGLPIGCEFLDPITPQYIADAVSWGAIGARTVESQVHRQMASGLSMPIGMKNRRDGDVQSAVDAVRSASASHVFTGVTENGVVAVMSTAGNADAHVILRGGTSGPNHGAGAVQDAVDRLRAAGVAPRLVIDASHDNSGKRSARQPSVANDIARQVGAGRRAIAGVMLESFLVEGRQDLTPGQGLTYGQSVTDECMGWETTEAVLTTLSESVRSRRLHRVESLA